MTTATPVPHRPHYPQPLPASQLEQALNGYCAQQARSGWRVTHRTGTTATLNGPALHIPIWITLLLVVPTLGASAVFARHCARRIRWRQVWVDQWGRVCVQNVARGI